MIERMLQQVALFSRRRYRLVFAVALVLTLVCFGLFSRLRFDTEVLNLLPQDDPVVSSFRETLEEFGSLDFLLMVVRIPEGQVVDPYFSYVDELGSRLETMDEIEYVDYRIGEIESLIEDFFPQAFMFLDEAGRERVEELISDEGIEDRVEEIRRLLRTPQALALRDLILLDPLGISEVFFDRLLGNRGTLRVDWASGYFLSQDRRLLLLVAKPRVPAQEVDFSRKLLQKVRAEVKEVDKQWEELAAIEADDPEVGDIELPPPPEVGYGGTYATAVEDARYLARDIITNAVTSMVGVLLLFLFAFRRFGVLVYAFVPLAFGLVLALGFAAATVGVLNAITSSFAALLVGLGIDFVIVSYGRYVEERRNGARLSAALSSMCGSSGRAVVTGGITTAATFYAFGVTEFTGLRQMGYLIGTGILFCMVGVLVLLPAMLAWSEDRHHRRQRRVQRYLHGFGAAPLVRFCWRFPKSTLAIGAAITVVAAVAGLQVRFVDSIKQMRPEGNTGVQVETEVGEKFGSGFDYMMMVLDEESEEAALRRSAEVTDRAKELIGTELNSVDSISSVLPPLSRQQETIAWLESRSDLLDSARLRAIFREHAEREGLRFEPFTHGFDLLDEAASARSEMSLSDLAHGDATERLLERYLRQVDGGWKSVVYLYPPPRTWKREAPPGVEALAAELAPEVVLTGVNLVSETLRVQVKSDAVVAAAVGFLLVALLLWLDYRRMTDTALSLAPLVIGVVWMMGGMRLFDINLNFFNIFVTTMIIGIGVDYGVHMMHRYRERMKEGDILGGLEETAKAIVLAALSTSVGFGSMSLSHYPGLRSMGLVAILGALSTSVVAITLLPAFLRLRHPGEDG